MPEERKYLEPVILFVKPQAISGEDRAALREVGVIVVETDDLSAVKLVQPHAELSSGDLLGLACRAIHEHGPNSEGPKTLFGKAVAAALASRQQSKP